MLFVQVDETGEAMSRNLKFKINDIVYVSAKHAPRYADRIAGVTSEEGCPLRVVGLDYGQVRVAMADGSLFLNGERELTIVMKILVPSPPSARSAARAS
jgi:hypothetical protein